MIANARRMNEWSNKRLRRARRLYFHLCKAAVLSSTDNTVMHGMILRMKERGLYAFPKTIQIPWRDFRYKIVRYLYMEHVRETGQCARYIVTHWSFWYLANGFDKDFNRVAVTAKTA